MYRDCIVYIYISNIIISCMIWIAKIRMHLSPGHFQICWHLFFTKRKSSAIG